MSLVNGSQHRVPILSLTSLTNLMRGIYKRRALAPCDFFFEKWLNSAINIWAYNLWTNSICKLKDDISTNKQYSTTIQISWQLNLSLNFETIDRNSLETCKSLFGFHKGVEFEYVSQLGGIAKKCHNTDIIMYLFHLFKNPQFLAQHFEHLTANKYIFLKMKSPCFDIHFTKR